MANTISTIAMNPLKNIVSKSRKRYQKDGFNLDLAYIQPNLIAMGYPAEKLERVYRNDIDDVKRFLDLRHPNKYKVYNLCSERQYDQKRFEHFSYYPFDDHNPPNIKLIKDFCDDVKKWLDTDDKNVAAIHCKAGKGRTGTMISCYLLHIGKYATAQEALNCYGQERAHDKKGVTIPSQRRYVEYYAYLLSTGRQYSPVSLQICEIKLSPPPLINSGTIFFSIFNTTTRKILDYEPVPDFKKTDDSVQIKMNQCIPLAGDIKVEFSKSKSKELFHFWFNTFFIDEMIEERNGYLVMNLTKSDLDDAIKDKNCKLFSSDFKVEIVMQKITSSPFANPYKNLAEQLETRTNNCHQMNNSYSNHILASFNTTTNGKSKLPSPPPPPPSLPQTCSSAVGNRFLAGPGTGNCGIDVVDNNSAAATVQHKDAHTPSESNSESASSSSEPSSSSEEWESGELDANNFSCGSIGKPNSLAHHHLVDIKHNCNASDSHLNSCRSSSSSSNNYNCNNQKQQHDDRYKSFYRSDDNYYCGTSLTASNQTANTGTKILAKRLKTKHSSLSDSVLTQKWMANMRSDPEFRENLCKTAVIRCETTSDGAASEKPPEKLPPPPPPLAITVIPEATLNSKNNIKTPELESRFTVQERKSPSRTSDLKRFFTFTRRESHDKQQQQQQTPQVTTPPSPPPPSDTDQPSSCGFAPSAPVPILHHTAHPTESDELCDIVTPPHVAQRLHRCVPFGLRELTQEIQLVIKNHQQNSSKLKDNKK